MEQLGLLVDVWFQFFDMLWPGLTKGNFVENFSKEAFSTDRIWFANWAFIAAIYLIATIVTVYVKYPGFVNALDKGTQISLLTVMQAVFVSIIMYSICYLFYNHILVPFLTQYQ